MKKIFILLLIIVASSCGDSFLDKKPQGQYNPEIITTTSGIEGALVGAYALLDGIGTSGVTTWHGAVSNWIFGSVVSDDAYKGSDAGDQPEQTFLERYVWLSTNTHIYGKWRTLYDGVARSNDVLKTLPKVTDLADARKLQIQAEARFLRGHYHFEAKKMWGNISYIDEVTWDTENPESVLIPNTEDAWPKIEADFQFASENLPETQTQPGRPTKYAALAYLAKCHMYRGFPKGQPNIAHLTAAKEALLKVVNSGKYRLMDHFHDNFAAETRNNAESIFEVQYTVTSADGSGGNQGDELTYMYPNGPGGCCGFYQASQNLVNAYKTDAKGLPMPKTFNDVNVKNDEGLLSSAPFEPYTGTLDPRLDWTVGRRGIPYIDWGVHPGRFWIRDQSYAGPYSSKKQIVSKAESGKTGNPRLSTNNYRLMRYDHVILWLAECEVELGNLEKAREYVNMVRARAARPDGFVLTDAGKPAANYLVGLYTDPWKDVAGAREAVRFENRLEFAMEGHRFFDLVRWGIAVQTLNTYLEKEKTLRTYLSGAKFEEKHQYYPIPQQAIVYSTKGGKASLVQNPGY